MEAYRIISNFFCYVKRKDSKLQKLSDRKVAEQLLQIRNLQSHVNELSRKLQDNSNTIRELQEKYVCSQNSLKECREEMQIFKERAEVERKAGIKARENMIRDQSKEIERLNEGNSKLQNKLAIIEKNAADSSNTSGSYADSSATPVLLEAAVHKAQRALVRFSKCLQENCVSDGGAVEVLRAEIIKEQRFARFAHSKFAYQHQICQLLFAEFEKEDFNLNGGFCTVFDMKDLAKASFQEYKHYNSAKLEDTAFEVLSNPEMGSFPKFYWEKLKAVLPIHLESPFPASINNLGNILEDKIYSAFLELSQSVWALHKLAFSFQPPARILRFGRFSDYNPTYMESLLGAEHNPNFLPKVGLMTMPGFQIRNVLMKCKIYPAGKETMA